jgi:DNA replication and repair protein RecF
LDDIFDKLDQTRVERLIKLVHDQFFGQVLVTDTDEDRVREMFAKNDLESKLFRVSDGAVEMAE